MCCGDNWASLSFGIIIAYFQRTPSLTHASNTSFQDFYLVTAGVRCAVLLDSKRAPRGSPPLADVLRELQDSRILQNRISHDSNSGGCDGHGDSVASLGLLRLEGSCFLVNRSMLACRLGEALACPYPHANAATAPPVPSRGHTVTTQPVAECSLAVPRGEARYDERAAISTIQMTPRHSPFARAAPGQGLDCAFVDVRKSLKGPVVRTDALAPRLCAALRSTFGGAAGDIAVNAQAATTADPPLSPLAPDAAASFGDQESGGNLSEEPSQGALWLRSWKKTDLILDSRGLSESLGDVGLPGFAGWLLEYPIIYCCSSLTKSGERSEDVGDAEAGQVGNCLALVPLTVYSLRLDTVSAASCPPREPNTSFEAFSFSVPQTVCCPTEAAGDDGNDDGSAWCDSVADRGQAVVASFNHLVDTFLERFERRIASRHCCSSAGGCERNEQWLERLRVSKRTETLDLVAL